VENAEGGEDVVYWILDDEMVGITIRDLRSRTLKKFVPGCSK